MQELRSSRNERGDLPLDRALGKAESQGRDRALRSIKVKERERQRGRKKREKGRERERKDLKITYSMSENLL